MMKRKRITAIFLAVCLLLTTAALPVSAEGFPYTWEKDGGGPHCESLLLVNLDTDSVAYAQNPDEKRPMASLTKIMTFIVAYENIPDIENTVITASEAVLDELEGTYSSTADIMAGEKLTGLQLLYLLMVPSANDAALLLANYVNELHAAGALPSSSAESGEEGSGVDSTQPDGGSGETGENAAGTENSDSGLEAGSEEDTNAGGEGAAEWDSGQDPTDYSNTYFVKLMNEKAEELGCENTHFMNPHGLYHPDHYATARDLYRITRYALGLPNFAQITGTPAYDLAATNMREEQTFYSTNKMFNNYEDNDGNNYFYTYTTGIKTGSLNEAGYCIVSSATADGYTYICVAMGSPMLDSEGNDIDYHGEMADSRELFRWALLNLEKKTVAAQGDLLGEVKLEYAYRKDTLQLVAGDNASALLPKAVNKSSVTIQCNVPESVQAPIKKGEQVGTATLSYADEVIATIPLVASESVERSPVITIFTQGKSLFTAPWFLIVMAVILVLVVFYIILMLLYRKKQKQLRRVKRFRDM